jgi:cell division inhibitor SulA
MTETWYRACGNDIDEVIIVKSTDHFVTLENGRRCARIGGYESFYKSKDEAVRSVRTKLIGEVESAERRMELAKADLEFFENTFLEGES